jgi:hypothetical protein
MTKDKISYLIEQSEDLIDDRIFEKKYNFLMRVKSIAAISKRKLAFKYTLLLIRILVIINNCYEILNEKPPESSKKISNYRYLTFKMLLNKDIINEFSIAMIKEIIMKLKDKLNDFKNDEDIAEYIVKYKKSLGMQRIIDKLTKYEYLEGISRKKNKKQIAGAPSYFNELFSKYGMVNVNGLDVIFDSSNENHISQLEKNLTDAEKKFIALIGVMKTENEKLMQIRSIGPLEQLKTLLDKNAGLADFIKIKNNDDVTDIINSLNNGNEKEAAYNTIVSKYDYNKIENALKFCEASLESFNFPKKADELFISYYNDINKTPIHVDYIELFKNIFKVQYYREVLNKLKLLVNSPTLDQNEVNIQFYNIKTEMESLLRDKYDKVIIFFKLIERHSVNITELKLLQRAGNFHNDRVPFFTYEDDNERLIPNSIFPELEKNYQKIKTIKYNIINNINTIDNFDDLLSDLDFLIPLYYEGVLASPRIFIRYGGQKNPINTTNRNELINITPIDPMRNYNEDDNEYLTRISSISTNILKVDTNFIMYKDRPYNDIFLYNMTNKYIYDNKISSLFNLVKEGYAINCFGYGFSGSGKSFTLIERTGNIKDKHSILYQFLYAYSTLANVYKDIKIVDIKELSAGNSLGVATHSFSNFISDEILRCGFEIGLFGEPEVLDNISEIITGISNERQNLISSITEFNRNPNVNVILLASIIEKIDIIRREEQRVKPTINNPNSSRSHLLIRFKITLSQTPGYITFIDMGGSENVNTILDQSVERRGLNEKILFDRKSTDKDLQNVNFDKLDSMLSIHHDKYPQYNYQLDRTKNEKQRDFLIRTMEEGVFINNTIKDITLFFKAKNSKNPPNVIIPNINTRVITFIEKSGVPIYNILSSADRRYSPTVFYKKKDKILLKYTINRRSETSLQSEYNNNYKDKDRLIKYIMFGCIRLDRDRQEDTLNTLNFINNLDYTPPPQPPSSQRLSSGRKSGR